MLSSKKTTPPGGPAVGLSSGITRRFVRDAAPNTEKLPVRLVLCFDGTGDTAEGSFSATEGRKTGTRDSINTIYHLCKPGPVTDPDSGKKMYQFVQYFEGVATIDSDKGGLLTQAQALFDGATGHGYLDIISSGYRVCCQQLQHDGQGEPPHEIFLFGFSRGAFIARALASFLQHVGLLKPSYFDSSKDEREDELYQSEFKNLLERYMEVTSKPSLLGAAHPNTVPSEPLPSCIPSPPVRVLGAFDTVKTVVNLPVLNYLTRRIAKIDFQIDAPGLVEHFRHALALNEARTLFNPDLWKSTADKAGGSYLEAWFFGYHHDIGGGDIVQGLALWPLQWILHTAVDQGLVLDPAEPTYEILFNGEHNVVESPHEIALKMFDMIKHHTLQNKVWGLKLNQPFSLTPPNPRQFFQFLTKPPYIKFLKPKVFIHPSAYLVFDVSSYFRIQVYTWPHFRQFLANRFHAIPQTSAPWWEKQTLESILEEAQSVECFNLLVVGAPNTGKEKMITKIFGEPAGRTNKGIDTAVSIQGNDQIKIHYSSGWGKGGTDSHSKVMDFLQKNRNNPNAEERIHAIWYFHDCSTEDIQESEKEFFKLDFGNIPLLVIQENEEKLRDYFREENVDDMDTGPEIERKTNRDFEAALARIQAQMQIPVLGKYVSTRNSESAPANILLDTSSFLDDDSIHIASIKAQRVEVKPKIALSAEESIRAYTLWYVYKTTGKVVPFRRNKSQNSSMSKLLMEPVMATFSMGFSGDMDLIRSKIAAPWGSELDKHTSLHDPAMPGLYILISMLDTIMVMTYAVIHRQNSKSADGVALPLTPEAVEKACTWYVSAPKGSTETHQEKLHGKVKALLSEDGLPKTKSIANLQMQVIEIVEEQAQAAETAPAGFLSGATSAAFTGLVNRFFGK